MSLPPWFVRAVPGVGMALTAAYVGYKLYEHWEERNQARSSLGEEEEGIPLQETNDDRAQLCRWLGLLDEQALDDIDSARLELCLEALSYLPVATRPIFVRLFQEQLTNDGHAQHLVSLLQSLGDNEEDENDDASRSTTTTSKEQMIVLLTQTTNDNVDTFLQAMEVCPNRPTFLNRLYILWNLNHLETVLEHLERRRQHSTQSLYQLVEAMVRHLPDDSSAHAFVAILTRLPAEDDNYEAGSRSYGLLRSLQLCDNNDDSSTTTTQLLHKLESLSKERLCQVTALFALFEDAQVTNLIQSLLEPPPVGNGGTMG